MPDITMCVPKCEICYRRKADPYKFQSWADFYEPCKNENYLFFIIRKETN